MRTAFSLVELSIVLVILGLLTGGILAGKSLIRASELRSVSTEYQRYLTATQAFRDKYMGLPGDLSNAQSFWGTMSGGTCPDATSGTGTQTCSGDGDGVYNSASAANRTGEPFTFWQHLANAGLIEGNYTGRAGSSGISHLVAGSNAPTSKIGSNSVWGVGTSSGATGNSYLFDYPAIQNFFRLGGQTSGWNYGAVLSPEEAWNVDTKLDDGNASQGRIWATRWDDCTPASSSSNLRNYDLTVSAASCGLIFYGGF